MKIEPREKGTKRSLERNAGNEDCIVRRPENEPNGAPSGESMVVAKGALWDRTKKLFVTLARLARRAVSIQSCLHHRLETLAETG
ncbi:hypothetical protein Pan216_04690 [Planctomycetes bacterium Pan216]|uniref:Uncharacterized protein n=1 Tax=Kolteria novifilia TaxID=2527975 RepID=A0A518AY34_9BACT|nr:hypothetical protein Pan216_04690 [Planctomycetes bacterium Pan216]